MSPDPATPSAPSGAPATCPVCNGMGQQSRPPHEGSFRPVPGFAFPPRDVLAQIAAHNANRSVRTMSAKMRAKMYVTAIVSSPNATQETLKLSCVSSASFGPNGESEDNTFARYTPFGTAEYGITNPALLGQFKPGDKFSVDFIPAE